MRPGAVLASNKFGKTLLDNPYSVTSMSKGKAPDKARKITRSQLKKFNKNSKIGMFCTGIILCEKTSDYLYNKGYKNVFQLKGGIINYLSKIDRKESLWKGECFVFDNRVSVNHSLNIGKYSICAGCREPISVIDKKSVKFEEGVSCPNCYNKSSIEQKKRFRMRQSQIDKAKKEKKNYMFKKIYK